MLTLKHGTLTGFWLIAAMVLLVLFMQQLLQAVVPGVTVNYERLLLTLATLGVSELCFYKQCSRWQEAIDNAKKKAESSHWLGDGK